MLIFPAIDILGGKAVRLLRGDYNQVTVYSERPWEIAEDFVSKGAKAIHIVDLDGAREGSAVNIDVVKKIACFPDVITEIGGGIRNQATVERYLNVGISRVILGTAALNDPVFLKDALKNYGERIVVGADLRDGKVAVKGWLEKSDKDGLDFLKELEDLGVGSVIVTDISRDGAMRGTNLEMYARIGRETSMKVTASGGVSTLEDVRALKRIGVWGAIIGKAYYTGAIDLAEAIKVAEGRA
ncbi:MAG: 1-(5-phosphoribosyl)-5-[Spirochaetales bacterium]|nr:1-(5-phosphoribosyl)-5-[(5-phosphoribosylamino)methylideneamino]imidazole-4-carboxamide isomerase [Spirochaetales bacterium]MBR6348884.1 1-(5-phosphoribosyl)-5-[(5-phosphoribosylamino)methylideneamino]imidazole-4-carboxamide isomerase [Spirochaetales bacterium]